MDEQELTQPVIIVHNSVWPTIVEITQILAPLAAAGFSFLMTALVLKQAFDIDVLGFLREWIAAQRERFAETAQLNRMWANG